MAHLNESRHEKTGFFAYAKTKTQISFVLISVFVFRYTASAIPLLDKSEIVSL